MLGGALWWHAVAGDQANVSVGPVAVGCSLAIASSVFAMPKGAMMKAPKRDQWVSRLQIQCAKEGDTGGAN